MDQDRFNEVVENRCRDIKMILAVKAKEYARGDRLHNFKRAAGFMKTAPEATCFAFAMKHFTSIADMVDDIVFERLPTIELAREKIGDAVNYLILLEALIEERLEAAKNNVLSIPEIKRSGKKNLSQADFDHAQDIAARGKP